MESATGTYACTCGAQHPLGVICDLGQIAMEHSHDQEEPCTCPQGRSEPCEHFDAANSCQCACMDSPVAGEVSDPSTHCAESCACSQQSEQTESHTHEHGSCCNHEHAPADPVDLSALGSASATKAIYRIVNMDCPMEEALIRKKLGGMKGITGLEFNLMQRVLTVNHELPSTETIEAALSSIDMKPEPVGLTEGAVSLFSVPGMDCPMEESLIRSKLAGMPGVFELNFNLMQRTLRIRHEPSSLPAISDALSSLNLDASLMDMTSGRNAEISGTEIPWRRLAFAGVFAAASEGFELIHEWHAAPFGINMESWNIGGVMVLEWLPMLFAVIAILLGGLTTYRKGWIAVRNFNLNINALMSVAVTGAVVIGQYPEAAMVMVLFNLAEAIEAKSLDRARNAIKALLNLTPEKATVLRADGSWSEVDIRQVSVGSRVRVKPGERVALDGVVTEGRSTINQAPITGESMPVEKGTGDAVYAGTINESGSFEFRVTASATNSTLARIIHAVEEAQGSKAPMQRFVDRFAKVYTPAVFLAAILVAVLPPLLMGGEWREWAYTALVLLVIGCPCALVISTPVSIVSGMAAATRQGILVKGGMFLEQGRLLKWLALDKTGTITHGKPCQTDFVKVGDLEEARATALACAIASRSDHPVSKAIAEKGLKNGGQPLDVEEFTAVPGQGVGGVIEGEQWHLGNHRMVEELKKCSPQLEERIFNLEKQGKSVVALIGEKGVQALFAVADTVKDSSITAIQELKRLGIKTMMLTGDNEHTASAIAGQVGVDGFKGNLLPEDKLRAVEELEKTGKVGMVGDGINDAPALARADVGFAMAAAGTDTAIETADVALMDDDLGKIPRFIKLSRSTYAILVQNIALALGVKAIFLALTLMGHATMWMAVFADVGTSLLVVANGLRAMNK